MRWRRAPGSRSRLELARDAAAERETLGMRKMGLRSESRASSQRAGSQPRGRELGGTDRMEQSRVL